MSSCFLDEKTRQKCLKAFLDVAILAALKKHSMNGYEITVHFMKKFGTIINPSVVYFTIYSLEREGLVLGVTRKRGRVYELTDKGLNSILKTQNAIGDLQNLIKTITFN